MAIILLIKKMGGPGKVHEDRFKRKEDNIG